MEIKFCKKVYNKKAILIAIRDFRKICGSKFRSNKDYFIVSIYPKSAVSNLKEEFCNYVLGIMKNNRMV